METAALPVDCANVELASATAGPDFGLSAHSLVAVKPLLQGRLLTNYQGSRSRVGCPIVIRAGRFSIWKSLLSN